MRSAVMALVGLSSCLAFAQPVIGPSLTGVTTSVNNGSGDQTDPHVSETTVAYTNQLGGSEIRFHKLTTGVDAAIPTSGAFDFLSDVSGNRIAFTRVTTGKSAIYVFDHTTGAPPEELAPSAGSNRRSAAIGADTVAWQDLGFSPNTFETEIVVHDLGTGVTTRLTNDSLFDLDPAVSAGGTVVTWTKCQTNGSQCDIWTATKVNGAWVSQPVTGAEGEEALPDSNGSLVVYDSLRGGERDIFWQPAVGGAEERLVLPGEQANPNISGSLIAFETRESAGDDWEIGLYDLVSHTYYQLTDTPLDETLSDISLGQDLKIRVVWSVREADANVYAFTFRLQQDCTPPPVGARCDNPGDRPLLFDATVERKCGTKSGGGSAEDDDSDDGDSEDGVDCGAKGNEVIASFGAVAGDGLLCVENSGGHGEIELNSDQIFNRLVLKKWVTQLEADVTLAARNRVEAEISGLKGTSYHLRIFGPSPTCQAGSLGNTEPGHGTIVYGETIDGQHASIEGNEHNLGGSNHRGGCSSGSDDMMFAALFAVLGILAVSRRPTPVRVRSRSLPRRRS
jgi:hypothetical protein